jgi:aconitate hydratase
VFTVSGLADADQVAGADRLAGDNRGAGGAGLAGDNRGAGGAGLAGGGRVPRELAVQANDREFPVTVRIDTPREQRYFQHGGILQFVLRELLGRS